MAFLPTQTIDLASVVPVYVEPDGVDDFFTPGDRTFIHVKNNSGATVTVTVDDPISQEPEGSIAFNPDVAVVVSPGENAFSGPFVGYRFASNDDGYVHISSDATTDVEVAVLSVNLGVG